MIPRFYYVDPKTSAGEKHLRVAWEIAQTHQDWYCFCGGQDSWEKFLADAQQAEWWMIVSQQTLHTIVSLFPRSRTELQYDLYTPRGADWRTIQIGVYTLGAQWFEQSPDEDRRLSILIPSFHRFSRRLARSCGMKDTGEREVAGTFRGQPITWERYAITSADYYERKENHHYTEQHINEHLRVL